MLEGFLYFVLVVDSLLLILLVLIQSGTGGGLASTFGGGGEESLLGSRGSETLSRWTSITASTFFILCCVLAYLSGQKEESITATLPGKDKPGAMGTNTTGGGEDAAPEAPEDRGVPGTLDTSGDDTTKDGATAPGTGKDDAAAGEGAGDEKAGGNGEEPDGEAKEPGGEPEAPATDGKEAPGPTDDPGKLGPDGEEETDPKPETDLKPTG